MPYINLDAIDLKILGALQDDGRLTNIQLSESVGLSPSPCLRRVRRLEKDGFIAAYRAALDREAVGLSLTVFVEIGLAPPSKTNAEALQAALISMPEVINCHMLSGPSDCLAEIVVPSIKAFDDLLNDRLRTLPMVGEVRSNIALKRIKSDAPIPLTHLRRPLDATAQLEPDCT